MARVFAGFEAILTLGVAAGAVLTPVVIELLGVRVALVAVGLLGPLVVLAAWPALRRLDAGMHVRDSDIALLQRVPMFCPLPQATIEQLAARLVHDTVPGGHTLFEEREKGDRVYVVEAGQAEVVRGAARIRVLERGECFGEIALLRDAVRNATVRAAAEGPLRVATLGRDCFLSAVTGYSPSAAAGERIVAERLSEIELVEGHR
jgi:CRP-like cAMP-binding protein